MKTNYRRFKFVKPFTCGLGTIDAGRELSVLNGVVYLDGGMLDSWFCNHFIELIRKEEENPNYLREVPIPFNKI